MFVITDTTPLNYLVRLGLESLLPQSYGSICIPHAVLRELQHPNSPAVVTAWIASPPRWLQVMQVQHADETLDPELGIGERETISLAQELKPEVVLMDDLKARAAAELRGFTVTGTLAVLRDAASQNKIDLAAEVQRLLELGFRAKPRLIQSLLNKP